MRGSGICGTMVLALSVAFGVYAGTDGEGRELTLMSYNVKSGTGMDRRNDCGRTAAVIKGVDPDVVAVQELDSMTNRSRHRYVLGELADLTGMKAYFAPAIDYDGGKYGIGILSKEEPVSLSRHALPGSEEKRTLIVAEFDDYVFACTHLSLTEADRLASAEIIREIAGKSGKSFFIAGDFNALPSSEVMTALSESFVALTDTAKLTFPADIPNRTLDYIMVDESKAPMVKLVSDSVVDAPMASDHRPVFVKVTL